jgi:aminoglycoside phosphotransferase (APT) family kinase protein
MAFSPGVFTETSITPAWLTAILRPHGVISGDVRSFALERIGVGQGFTATLWRLRLTVSDPLPEPVTLVAKSGAEDAETRLFLAPFLAREARFYAEIAPTADLPTPHVFYAAADEATGEFLIIMEDLSHYAWPGLIEGCSLEQAQLAVEQLAALHARWWDAEELRAVDWIPTFMADADESGSSFRSMWERMTAHYSTLIPPNMAALGERLYHNFPAIYAALVSDATQERLTMCHGDYRLGNLAFATLPLDPPIKVIDWSHVRKGRGATDLVYFVPTGPAWGDALIERYYGTLRAHGVSGYSHQQFQHDLRAAALQVFWFAVRALGRVVIGKAPNADMIVGFACPALSFLEQKYGLLDLVDGAIS